MGDVVTFEQARSGRSTCRACGEPIAKGDWRCGFETWIGGRVAMAWMKPLPFLQDYCRIEYAASQGGSQGACKKTGTSFRRGDLRVVLTAGDPQKKAYLSLEAAGAELAPVVVHVGRRAFPPTTLSGLADLAAEDRQAFYQAFAVSASEAGKFDRQHPPPQRPSFDRPTSTGKAAKAAAVGKADEVGGAEEADAAAPGGRPAKRARAAAAVMAGDSAGSGGRGAASEELPQEPQQGGLTALELERLDQIRRNRQRMEALGLPELAHELAPAPRPPSAATKHKGVSRKRLSEVLPRRESSRIRGVAPDGTQVHSERQGEVVVVQGEVIRRYAAGGGMSEEHQPQERHPQGELQFGSTNASHANDEAFIQLLAAAAASSNSGASPRGGKPLRAAGAGRLRLAADDVAKVTKDAITHLAFHPTTDTLILACADKKGNLGLWHVDEGTYQLPAGAAPAQPILRRPSPALAAAGKSEQGEEGDGSQAKPAATSEAAVSLDSPGSGPQPGGSGGGSEEVEEASGSGGEEDEEGGSSEAFDGVLALQQQHYEYISGLKWAGGAGRGASLFTAAYDGSLRRLDVTRGVSELLVASEEAEYSCMDVTGDGRTALLGDNDGLLRLVDVRAPGGGGMLGVPGKAHSVHRRKINTIHIEPGAEQVFATASTDATVCLWDLRTLGSSASGSSHIKPLATAQHAKGCQAAMFAPDGSRRVASTSFDNTVRVWDGAKRLAPLLSIEHDNNTGRWVLPFRATWTSAGDGVVIGNMQRMADVFDASTGALTAQLHGEAMTAIPSRNVAHPSLPVLAAATNSGRVHIYR